MSSRLFNPIDLGSVAMILLCLLFGLRNGVFRELLRVIYFLFISFCALRFYRPLGGLLASNTPLPSPACSQALAFIFIVFTVGLCLIFALALLQFVGEVITAKKFRTGGGLLGMVRGIIVAFLILFGASLWPRAEGEGAALDESVAGKVVAIVGPRLVEFLSGVRVVIQPASDWIEKAESSIYSEDEPADR